MQEKLELKKSIFFLFQDIDQFRTLKNDFETKNFDIFDKVVHDFGKPNEVTI